MSRPRSWGSPPTVPPTSRRVRSSERSAARSYTCVTRSTTTRSSTGRRRSARPTTGSGRTRSTRCSADHTKHLSGVIRPSTWPARASARAGRVVAAGLLPGGARAAADDLVVAAGLLHGRHRPTLDAVELRQGVHGSGRPVVEDLLAHRATGRDRHPDRYRPCVPAGLVHGAGGRAEMAHAAVP